MNQRIANSREKRSEKQQKIPQKQLRAEFDRARTEKKGEKGLWQGQSDEKSSFSGKSAQGIEANYMPSEMVDFLTGLLNKVVKL
jgi:hypothetical protein